MVSTMSMAFAINSMCCNSFFLFLNLKKRSSSLCVWQGALPSAPGLPSSSATLAASTMGLPSLSQTSHPQATGLQQSRQFTSPGSSTVLYPVPHIQDVAAAAPFSHSVSTSSVETSPLKISHLGKSPCLSPTSTHKRVPSPSPPAVSHSVPIQTTGSAGNLPSSRHFPGKHSFPQTSTAGLAPSRKAPSSPFSSFAVADLGSAAHPLSSEELELQGIVERMATAFPLNVESGKKWELTVHSSPITIPVLWQIHTPYYFIAILKPQLLSFSAVTVDFMLWFTQSSLCYVDIPVEFHGDLFLAASLVGDGMQSMVTEVSRKTGMSIPFVAIPVSQIEHNWQQYCTIIILLSVCVQYCAHCIISHNFKLCGIIQCAQCCTHNTKFWYFASCKHNAACKVFLSSNCSYL